MWGNSERGREAIDRSVSRLLRKERKMSEKLNAHFMIDPWGGDSPSFNPSIVPASTRELPEEPLYE